MSHEIHSKDYEVLRNICDYKSMVPVCVEEYYSYYETTQDEEYSLSQAIHMARVLNGDLLYLIYLI